MFDHVSIGVSDIARAKRFYDAALAPVPADPNSGLHFCFLAPHETAVQAFHAAALRAGGEDNGGPGIRREYSPGYYAAFAIDPDGYRVEAFCRATAS